MKKVFICSPYAGDIEDNTRRAIIFCRFEIEKGNVPFAPHLIYPQILDENDPAGREKGISLGLEMMKVCDELVVFGHRISEGMNREISEWKKTGKPITDYTGLVCV